MDDSLTAEEEKKDMQKRSNHKLGTDFKLERYKFIVQEIHLINESVHKYLALFQTLTTAIVGGGIAVFLWWKKYNLDPVAAQTAIYGLLGLFIILALFVILSIIAGMISWYDYRNEEVELLNECVYPRFRKKPQARNFWRWYETYLILFVLIIVIMIYSYVVGTAIPMIK